MMAGAGRLRAPRAGFTLVEIIVVLVLLTLAAALVAPAFIFRERAAEPGLAAVVAGMEGGVYINLGSSVVMPEVFLKTISLGRNLGHDLIDITTVNMDFLSHYRPLTNVVRRPTQKGGRGYSLVGHHEIMFPLLAAAVLEELA